jgi:hypothetical protein
MENFFLLYSVGCKNEKVNIKKKSGKLNGWQGVINNKHELY